ncbi:GNAT family N-acetyltransferase [Paenibacillus timonensis]|uniref:GNAT family N-acetyltransferase n=1 Tax=Paenibacillus timonensis TaxID=225915 RepID=A0ABW3S637_9BACL|nr:GNAT family N-acetyltransferase [Paenibacillus timonensis]MCH1638530.1 GNAT family N-acetyltransferase [Paenibacillus timonensis]GJM82523.1 putative N-acetyltransferase YsnE [Paenibacillus sp. HMSSN-139]
MLTIKLDDLSGPEIRAFIGEHLANMAETSPPESIHALNVDGLKKSDVTFWSAWIDGELVGCGALKELDGEHGEVKSMRTSIPHRGKGVARQVLAYLLEEAARRGYRRVSLETGSMEAFVPARRLYESFGFTYCEPFADYAEDPNSVFMTKAI